MAKHMVLTYLHFRILEISHKLVNITPATTVKSGGPEAQSNVKSLDHPTHDSHGQSSICSKNKMFVGWLLSTNQWEKDMTWNFQTWNTPLVDDRMIKTNQCGNENKLLYKYINWLVVSTPPKNMKVNGKDYIPYMKWKIKFMFETTNQL